jgi:hypothetical protein
MNHDEPFTSRTGLENIFNPKDGRGVTPSKLKKKHQPPFQ